MTETAGSVLCLLPGDHDPGGPRAALLGSIGKPMPWHEVEIRDPATGAPCPPGVDGEIWVRSGQNMLGYWHQPELTSATLSSDGWLRTGDAGVSNAEGYLFMRDRLKDMIISGGENIYPVEVEMVLAQHPDVDEVVVIGVSHERWGESVMALVVRREGAALTADQLIDFCRLGLARYKCPRSVEFVETLPKNASGKVLKRVLREQFGSPSVTSMTAGTRS
jgi:long-chain acyl-CoA synthetase